MSAPARLFVNVRSARAAACVAACAALAGCIGNPLAVAPIDPRSTAAAEIAGTARSETDFPSFNEVPVKPTDIRPVRMFGEAADKVLQARTELEAATAPGTWTLDQTAAFAATANKAAGPAAPVTAATDTDAYAAGLRRRATPPPPPKR